MINREKRSKALSEVKLVKNKKKKESAEFSRDQSFQVPCKRKSFLHINCETNAYGYYNPFRLKGDNISQRNRQSQLNHAGLCHIEQECQESLIQGKIHNQQNLNEGLKYS